MQYHFGEIFYFFPPTIERCHNIPNFSLKSLTVQDCEGLCDIVGYFQCDNIQIAKLKLL